MSPDQTSFLNVKYDEIRNLILFVQKRDFSKEEALKGIKTILFILEEAGCDIWDIPDAMLIEDKNNTYFAVPEDLRPKSKNDLTHEKSPEWTAMFHIERYILFNVENNRFIEAAQESDAYNKIVSHQIPNPYHMPRVITRLLLGSLVTYLQSMAYYKFGGDKDEYFLFKM